VQDDIQDPTEFNYEYLLVMTRIAKKSSNKGSSSEKKKNKKNEQDK
jgi:hypothetical protein